MLDLYYCIRCKPMTVGFLGQELRQVLQDGSQVRAEMRIISTSTCTMKVVTRPLLFPVIAKPVLPR